MQEVTAIKQAKFSNGEISPMHWGDVSHPKWQASLRTCKNWLPTPTGAVTKRPALVFKANVKDPSYAPRLIPFVFSDAQSFVLEFGDRYIRFYQNGQYVGVGGLNAGACRELPTNWTQAMLPYLKFWQIGDTITICYRGQATNGNGLPPQDLTHTPGALWPWVLSNTPTSIPANVVTWVGPPGDSVFPWNNGVIYSRGDRVTTLDAAVPPNLVEWTSIQDNNLNHQPPNAALNAAGTAIQGSLYWMPSIDQSHPPTKWQFVQTAVVQDSFGIVYESQPTPVLTLNVPLSNDRQRALIPAIPHLAAGYTLILNKLYRSSGGTFGWVKDFTAASLIVTPALPGCVQDEGSSPDYTKQPPKATDPFLIGAVDSYPGVIGYLDQRRLFGGFGNKLPQQATLSKLNDLYNWDTDLIPGADTDAFKVLLSSEVLEEWRSFVPMRRGLIMTSQGEWAVAGQGGGPVSRSSVDVKRQSKWGSSWLSPIVIGTGILFITAKSNMVRDLYPLYGLYADIWDGQEVSVMARHLFDLHTVKDWAFQSVPYPVVWAVRDDGVLLSLTYQHAPPSYGAQLAEGVVAWAQHSTGVGSDTFESICVVPEPPEDAVYVVVKRLIRGAYTRTIERMTSPVCPASPYAPGVSDVRYAQYLDGAVSYDGHADKIGGLFAHIDSVANPGSTNLADFGINSQVTVTASMFVASDSDPQYGSMFVMDPENTLGLGVVKAKIIGYTNATTIIAELQSAMTVDQLKAWAAGYGAQQSVWAIAKGQITVANLDGYQVDSGDGNGVRGLVVLADGDVQAPALFAAGVAYLNNPAVVIQVGVAYNSDLQQLDAHHPNQEIRNMFKNVVRLGFELSYTRDLWAGPDFTKLVQWKQRSVADAYGVIQPQSGYYEMDIKSDENKAGIVAVRHFLPLPATITALTREMDISGP